MFVYVNPIREFVKTNIPELVYMQKWTYHSCESEANKKAHGIELFELLIQRDKYHSTGYNDGISLDIQYRYSESLL